jgi:uncharacterized protein
MRHLFIAALFFISMNALAQEGFKGEHFIEVNGVAETEIDPNEITMQIRLREFEENKNKVQLEKLDQDFLTALKAAGIDKKRLVLAEAGANLSKLGRRDKDAFRVKTYQLILTNAAELEKLLEKLESVKVDHAAITRVHHSDLEKYRLDLKVKALQVAKSKAEMLVKSIGSEIGKPLMIREWEIEPVQPYLESNMVFKANRGAVGMDDMEMAEEPTAFKKIRLRTQVTAQFEIK